MCVTRPRGTPNAREHHRPFKTKATAHGKTLPATKKGVRTHNQDLWGNSRANIGVEHHEVEERGPVEGGLERPRGALLQALQDIKGDKGPVGKGVQIQR